MNDLRRFSSLWLPDYHLRFPPGLGFAQPNYFLPGMCPGMSVAQSGAAPFTTAWKSAGAGANDASVGDVAWSNPGNITASDDNYASAGDGGFFPITTQILRATNFGFTTSDIPSGATILGIEVGIERRNEFSDSTDVLVQLRTGSGRTGDDKADTGTTWPSSDAEVIYGGAADDWNAGLTDADIRGSDFGVDFRADAADTFSSQPDVDHIRIRVHGMA